MKNNYLCHAPYIRKSIAYDHDFGYTNCKMMISPGVFFLILIFGVKAQKIAQNEK